MSQDIQELPFSALINPVEYRIESLESEIRADLCTARLLKFYHRWLLDNQGCEPLAAGQLASGADYFLREFLIGSRRQNIFAATAEQLRQFGGNWYIISNLEPNIPELKPMLSGTARFYNYCCELNLVTAEVNREITAQAEDIDYFKERLESFFELRENDYPAWNQACPLR